MDDYVVYCDESSQSHPARRPFYTLGSIWLPRVNRDRISRDLREIKLDNGIRGEVKWHKLSRTCFDSYWQIVQYFLDCTELRFRTIAVDQRRVKYDTYHQGDPELGFYKFYYQMLFQWLTAECRYLVLLDFKTNRGAGRFTDLKRALGAKAALQGAALSDLTIIDSRDSHIMQLTDLLTGATAAAFNEDLLPKSPKSAFIDKLAKQLGRGSLNTSTSKTDQKFNVFRIDLR
ncbi:MAG: DUF3800 domain-containing protein [Deltaproteobacteria bacterium]|nr:DUF3800 domain-containing protein [Deltaproteobacteria bacterium]